MLYMCYLCTPGRLLMLLESIEFNWNINCSNINCNILKKDITVIIVLMTNEVHVFGAILIHWNTHIIKSDRQDMATQSQALVAYSMLACVALRNWLYLALMCTYGSAATLLAAQWAHDNWSSVHARQSGGGGGVEVVVGDLPTNSKVKLVVWDTKLTEIIRYLNGVTFLLLVNQIWW